MELRLTVPEEQEDRFVVEFPGYISDKKGVKALETFGGLEGLRKQRKDHPKFLKLKLRPEDGFCHALHSDDVKKSNNLLLQIDRSSLAAGQRPQGRVVRAGSLYRFFTPADIQLGGSVKRSEASFSSAQHREEVEVDLKCGPPVFQLESPLEFMVDVYGSHGSSRTATDLSLPQGGDLWLDYMTVLVPQDSMISNADTEKERSQPFMGEVRSKLEKLFAERPVCLEAPLFARLRQEGILDRDKSGEKVRKVLRRMCYKFRTGPWRYAWIRNGYDPRKVNNSVAWQVITLSSSSEYDESTLLDSANADTMRNYDSVCGLKGTPIKFPLCIQLLDIQAKNDSVREGIRETASQPLDAPDDNLGWFSESTWESMKSDLASMLAKSVGVHVDISMGVTCMQGLSSQVQHRKEDSKIAKRKQPDKDTGHTIVGSDGNIKQLFELVPKGYANAIAASLGVHKSSKPQNLK